MKYAILAYIVSIAAWIYLIIDGMRTTAILRSYNIDDAVIAWSPVVVPLAALILMGGLVAVLIYFRKIAASILVSSTSIAIAAFIWVVQGVSASG